MKKAYENWNQVIEYDGKVLNSLTNSKKGSRSVASIMHHNINYAIRSSLKSFECCFSLISHIYLLGECNVFCVFFSGPM